MKRFKKVLFTMTAVALLSFFALPAMVFGDPEPPPKYAYHQVEGSEIYGNVYVGQYQLKELDGNNNKTGDPIDVFCIDGDVTVNNAARYAIDEKSVYETLKEEFEADLNPNTTEKNAVAVQILSTTATGATPVQDQGAIWKQTQDLANNVSTSLQINYGTVI